MTDSRPAFVTMDNVAARRGAPSRPRRSTALSHGVPSTTPLEPAPGTSYGATLRARSGWYPGSDRTAGSHGLPDATSPDHLGSMTAPRPASNIRRSSRQPSPTGSPLVPASDSAA